MKNLKMLPVLLLAGLVVAGCKKEERLTQAGDINLAGCEVPAGLTPEQAERVECTSNGTAGAPDKSAIATAEGVATSAMTAAPEADVAAAAAAPAADDAVALGSRQVATPDAEVIQTAISARAAQDGGSEYADARRSVEGDLNGDGTPDLAVLYILEGAGGGNNAYSYLAAFARSTGQLKLTDTIILSGSAQGIALKGGVIHLQLLSPGLDDPDCCPSVVEDAVYVLHGGKLLQVQAQP